MFIISTFYDKIFYIENVNLLLNKNRNNKVQIQLIPSVEQQLIDVAEENCHVPAHKMIVVQELYSYIHFLVRRNI